MHSKSRIRRCRAEAHGQLNMDGQTRGIFLEASLTTRRRDLTPEQNERCRLVVLGLQAHSEADDSAR